MKLSRQVTNIPQSSTPQLHPGVCVPEFGVEPGQELVEHMERGLPLRAPHHPRLLKQQHLHQNIMSLK